MSNLIIRQGLETVLQTWANAQNPVIQVAHENVIQEPINNYLECYLIPSKNVTEALDGAHNCYSGIFQIIVIWRKGFGYGNAGAIAESVAALFPCDLQIVVGDIVINIIEPPSILAAVTTDRNYCVPILITYRSDIIQQGEIP